MGIINYVEIGKDNDGIKGELLEAIEKILVSGKFILGEETKKFEENIARLIKTKYAVGVNSGTDALFLSMKALGIGKGDEVIVPANSFISSATTVALTGATPVFIDVRENYLIDEGKIGSLITEKTKAIMPVDFTGKPCNMSKILEMAKKKGLFLIEDCAQAVLAKWGNKPVGSFGVGCFSLHPIKNLGACGDGGIITTNDGELYDQLIQLRNIGLKNRNEADILGYNSRLDTLQAAILNVKLKYLAGATEKRRRNALTYYNLLKEKKIREVKYVPHDEKNEFSVYSLFTIQAEKRDKLMVYLKDKGIETAIYYPIPIHKQKCFEYLKAQSLPNAELQAKMILSLPIHAHVSEKNIQFICDEISNFYKN
ncbi:DegT/DnrJ/EryC1/StrS family aminotransferase [Candidatus Woesearchaeota archaeon]|nr:DegT/DnrJ/EryC1/StrS family aminotransferase [Candidatus Woesearchaeota archaeon]